MRALLTIEDLRVGFRVPGGTVEAVKGVSFTVPQGGTVAVVGESGSGKSVISQTVMGILPANGRIRSGRVLFDDPATAEPPIDLAALDPESRTYRQIRGGRISIIFQEPMTSLSPLHTVGDQIIEAVRLHQNVSRRDARELARRMLALVDFPDAGRALVTYPFELSGGLRQRAMIAMALVCRPSLLIADEPTTALDVTIQALILKLIDDLQEELGMAVLMITHDLGVVANTADDVVVMYRGEVMESGTLDQIFRRPEHPYLRALLQAVPRFDMKEGERLQPIREIDSAGGALMADRDPANAQLDRGVPLLKVGDVSKTFRIRKAGAASGSTTVQAVRDVGFSVQRGECLGLVGESGCGKTTLSKILMRALSPDDGAQLTYHTAAGDIDLLRLQGPGLKAFRRRMQFIFQDPFSSLNPRMTIYDILTEPLAIHGIGDGGSRAEMAIELMRLVGLDTRHLQRYPHSFSGGQRQRIGIARALALRPELVICDEPVSALDVSIQAQVLNLLKDLQEKLHLTYLFISHNLAVVDYIADRIMVMCRGTVVEVAPREVLFRNPVHPYTQALLAAVPHPNPDEPLDLAALMGGRASEPAAWPAPFTRGPGAHLELTDIGGGHYVRQHAAAAELEIA